MRETQKTVLDAIERDELRLSRRSWIVGLLFLGGLLLAVLLLGPASYSTTKGTIEAVQVHEEETGSVLYASVRLESGQLVTARAPSGSADAVGSEVQLRAGKSLFGRVLFYRVLSVRRE